MALSLTKRVASCSMSRHELCSVYICTKVAEPLFLFSSAIVLLNSMVIAIPSIKFPLHRIGVGRGVFANPVFHSIIFIVLVWLCCSVCIHDAVCFCFVEMCL